jgi:hypothetical protein
MATETRKISYFRTLIFTIMAAVFSLALMGLLFFKVAYDYIIAIVAVQLGVFAIIGYCIYIIVKREKMMDEMKNPKNYLVRFDDCPDYFTKVHDPISGKHFCSNEYIVSHPQDSMKKTIMKIVEENVELPEKHIVGYPLTGSVAPTDKFMIHTFKSAALNDNQTRCSLFDESKPIVSMNNDHVPNRTEYRKLPWTSVKSRCNGLYGSFERPLVNN